MLPDTIAAPITAPGRSAVSVIRVSGPKAVFALEKLIHKHGRVLNAPRQMHLVPLLDLWGAESSASDDHEDHDAGGDNDPELDYPPPQAIDAGALHPDIPILDSALVVYFPAPHSFTGEDCVEFNLHGSPFLVGRLLENLAFLGIRLALPGEFTQRAYLNGQVDLSQAEAVADIIAAETAAQARLAQQQLEGRLSKAILELGEPLRDLVAEIEAYIDFPDEGIEPLTKSGWDKVIRSVRLVLKGYIDSYSTGRLYREGVQIALAGAPNAGKSSLLNAFCNEDRAIVTPIPGTTRDSIEIRVTLGGLEASLWDTAGIIDEENANREIDVVEKLGVERSWKQVRNADLVLVLIDPSAEIPPQVTLAATVVEDAKRAIVVLNKADLLTKPEIVQLANQLSADLAVHVLPTSALNRFGVDELCTRIAEELVGSEDPTASVLITNQRHHEALTAADRSLQQVEDALKKGEIAAEFVSLDLRSALGALQDIVGVTHTEDLLGRIFSKFCIGK